MLRSIIKPEEKVRGGVVERVVAGVVVGIIIFVFISL
jgi:hypothetical protein